MRGCKRSSGTGACQRRVVVPVAARRCFVPGSTRIVLPGADLLPPIQTRPHAPTSHFPFTPRRETVEAIKALGPPASSVPPCCSTLSVYYGVDRRSIRLNKQQ